MEVTPNYRRNLAPLNGVYVKRVVRRDLKLPRHSKYTFHQVPEGKTPHVLEVPYLVAAIWVKTLRCMVVCHRVHNGGMIIPPPKPPGLIGQ